MKFLTKLESFVKPITDRLSGSFPESRLKDSLRAIYYSFLNPSFTMKALGNGVFQINALGQTFRVGQVPGFEVGNDLIALRGYLAGGANLRPGQVVVDAGASASGIATMCLAKLVGNTGKVIALEPDKKNFKILCDNLKLNGITNVEPLNLGLWHKREALKFASGMGESSSVQFSSESTQPVEVIECVDLDQLLQDMKIPRVDFIKMDIEGAEIEALQGMTGTLKKGVSSLAIASYHFRDGSQTCQALEPFFEKLGYRAHTAHPIHLTTYAFGPSAAAA